MLRSVKYGLHGAVLAGLIAAPVLWTTVDKTVHLTVDGKATTVRTTASNVGDVLDDRGLQVSKHDLVAPRTKHKVSDGMDVVLRRGRLLHLDVDGRKVSVWTTAPTVKEALGQLGYTTDDFVSVSRARRLPLGTTAIAIRTPRVVTVIHDGKRDTVSTTSRTVGDVLRAIGVVPDSDDRLSISESAPTAEGQTVTLRRVGRKTMTRTELVKHEVSRRSDAKLEKGTTRIVKAGHDGKARVTYSVVYVDGKAVGKTKVKTVSIADARSKVIAVGTKKTAAGDGVPSAGLPGPGSAKAIARDLLKSYGWGDTQYDCLVVMWDHESGWRVNAANPSGAYGIPQALPGSKMSSAGPNWQTSAKTQIEWGLGYIKARYHTPCGAWGFWQAHNYY